MKLDVVQKVDGNINIVSTWTDNPDGAKKAYHSQSANLYSDKSFETAWIAILDEMLNVYENFREKIYHNILTYTVSFNSYGGSSVESQVVKKGETATMPENPTKEGYEFVGWELNGYAYDFGSPITKDITLVARWQEEVEPEEE